MTRLLLTCFMIGSFSIKLLLYSQISTQADSIGPNLDSEVLNENPNQKNKEKTPGPLRTVFSGKPGKALALSLLLPGAGQVYNKRYWKLPIAYGLLAAPAYFIYFNTNEYNRFQTAYKLRIDLGDASPDEFQGRITSAAGIKSYRDLYDKRLQQSYVFGFIMYLIIGMDAFVDRHLMEFDVSDDLSLNLQPQIGPGSGGLAFQMKF